MGVRSILAAWLAISALAMGAHAAQFDDPLLEPHAIPRFVDDPVWTAQPSAPEIDQAAPAAVVAAREGGMAITECRIDSTGRLNRCATVAESPVRSGLGEAALGLMFNYRMQPLDAGGAPTEGGVVYVPTTFNVPGQPAPPPALHFAAGEEAYLVNLSEEGKPVGKIICPTAQEPRRKCFLHALKWKSAPDFVQRALYMRRINRSSGRSLVECAVDAAGLLTACDASADMVSTKRDALLTLMAAFRPAAVSEDQQPLSSGRVLIGFDWETLSRAVNASSLTRLDGPPGPTLVSALTNTP